MKIAGLTWWRNNYGSILQAYALQQVISSFEDVEYRILCQYSRKIASADNFIDKLKQKGIYSTIKGAFWKVGFKGLRSRTRKFQNFVDERLHISEKVYNEETIYTANDDYDGFICGSDQIWNPILSGLDSIYWLGFAKKGKKKIAYAPSIGVDDISVEDAAIIQKSLVDYDAISCREKSGTRLLNRVIGKNVCRTVLDPTLMVNKEVWNNLCPPRKYTEPYIFVYMLRGTKKQRQMVERYAKGRNLKIVTMPFLETDYTEWYDLKFGDIKYWDATPDEFISIIRYAEYVFTDSFHSSVFSCLYHTTFFVFPKVGRSQLNRVTDLQNMLEIPSRIVTNGDEIRRLDSEEPINWTRVDEILDYKRSYSQSFLKTALDKGERNE